MSRPNVTPPPAYLLGINVANFRCFKERQILRLNTPDDEHRPAQWTVIIGENGVGKTTLLQIAGGCQPGHPSASDSILEVSETDTENEYEEPGEGSDSVLPRIFVSPVKRYSREWIDSFTSAGNGASVGLSFCVGSSLDSFVGKDTFRFIAKMVLWKYQDKTSVNPYKKDDLQGLVCYGFGASRRMSRKAVTESRTEEPCLTLFDDLAELLNAEEWLVLSEFATKTGSDEDRKLKLSKRHERVKKLLIDMLPDVEDFRFGTADPDAPIPTPRVEAKTPYGWVRVRDLSLGYQAALAWMVDLASRLFERYPDSENPLAEPAVVLVDEIDLHLHPKWQRQLIQTLTETFPNTQFIVTAHSPLIVQAAPDANLALLRRVGDHVEIVNDVDEIRNWRVDQILTSELFGLTSARPPQVEKLLEERRGLIGKTRLTGSERQRLSELDAEIDRMPGGETAQDMEAMDIIREAADLIRSKRSHQK